jgi:hypothetical protein
VVFADETRTVVVPFDIISSCNVGRRHIMADSSKRLPEVEAVLKALKARHEQDAEYQVREAHREEVNAKRNQLAKATFAEIGTRLQTYVDQFLEADANLDIGFKRIGDDAMDFWFKSERCAIKFVFLGSDARPGLKILSQAGKKIEEYEFFENFGEVGWHQRGHQPLQQSLPVSNQEVAQFVLKIVSRYFIG